MESNDQGLAVCGQLLEANNLVSVKDFVVVLEEAANIAANWQPEFIVHFGILLYRFKIKVTNISIFKFIFIFCNL